MNKKQIKQIKNIRKQYFLLQQEFQDFYDRFDDKFEKIGIMIEKFEKEIDISFLKSNNDSKTG